jgi:hypothetical protein
MAGGCEKPDPERWAKIVAEALKVNSELHPHDAFAADFDNAPSYYKPRSHVICLPDQVPVRYADLLSVESALAQMEEVVDRLGDANARLLPGHEAKHEIGACLEKARYLLSMRSGG